MGGVIVASSLVVTMIYENTGTYSGGEDGSIEEDEAASKARETCWNLTAPPSSAFPATSIPSVFTIS